MPGSPDNVSGPDTNKKLKFHLFLVCPTSYSSFCPPHHGSHVHLFQQIERVNSTLSQLLMNFMVLCRFHICRFSIFTRGENKDYSIPPLMSLIDLNTWDSLKKFSSYFILNILIDHKKCSFEWSFACSLLVHLKSRSNATSNDVAYWKHFRLLKCLWLSVCQSDRTSQRVAILKPRQRSPRHRLSPRQSPPTFCPYQEDK